MWLIAMKGLPGCGKSAVARALGKQVGYPVIDKDDIKDIIDGSTPEAGPLAYETMFNVARRQLMQGLDVICDSPLAYAIGYHKAQRIAAEAHAVLVIVECLCSDEQEWSRRINGRKQLHLPAHHQTDWDTFRANRHHMERTMNYPVSHPCMIVDTIRPLDEVAAEIVQWLRRLRKEQRL